jgi:hypothetical protein
LDCKLSAKPSGTLKKVADTVTSEKAMKNQRGGTSLAVLCRGKNSIG